MLRLKQAQLQLQKDSKARRDYERMWGRPVDPGLSIIHFFERLDNGFAAPLPWAWASKSPGSRATWWIHFHC